MAGISILPFETVQTGKGNAGNKQDKLISGENIKTINGETILGEGNLVIDTLPEYLNSVIMLAPLSNSKTIINAFKEHNLDKKVGQFIPVFIKKEYSDKNYSPAILVVEDYNKADAGWRLTFTLLGTKSDAKYNDMESIYSPDIFNNVKLLSYLYSESMGYVIPLGEGEIQDRKVISTANQYTDSEIQKLRKEIVNKSGVSHEEVDTLLKSYVTLSTMDDIYEQINQRFINERRISVVTSSSTFSDVYSQYARGKIVLFWDGVNGIYLINSIEDNKAVFTSVRNHLGDAYVNCVSVTGSDWEHYGISMSTKVTVFNQYDLDNKRPTYVMESFLRVKQFPENPIYVLLTSGELVCASLVESTTSYLKLRYNVFEDGIYKEVFYKIYSSASNEKTVTNIAFEPTIIDGSKLSNPEYVKQIYNKLHAKFRDDVYVGSVLLKESTTTSVYYRVCNVEIGYASEIVLRYLSQSEDSYSLHNIRFDLYANGKCDRNNLIKVPQKPVEIIVDTNEKYFLPQDEKYHITNHTGYTATFEMYKNSPNNVSNELIFKCLGGNLILPSDLHTVNGKTPVFEKYHSYIITICQKLCDIKDFYKEISFTVDGVTFNYLDGATFGDLPVDGKLTGFTVKDSNALYNEAKLLNESGVEVLGSDLLLNGHAYTTQQQSSLDDLIGTYKQSQTSSVSLGTKNPTIGKSGNNYTITNMFGDSATLTMNYNESNNTFTIPGGWTSTYLGPVNGDIILRVDLDRLTLDAIQIPANIGGWANVTGYVLTKI